MKKVEEKLISPLVLRITIYVALFVVYIFPQPLVTNLLKNNFPVDKLIFAVLTTGLFILNKLYTKRFPKSQIVFLVISAIAALACQDLRCLLFIYLLLVEDIIADKDKVLMTIRKSSILYICLFFTFCYTLIYRSLGIVDTERFAFSAIGEINQSGLAIFCLAVMLMQKNKKVGYFTMFFGFLTISRAYFVAVILYLLSKTNVVKRMVGKIKHWWMYGYPFIVFVSSIILLGIGVFYIHENALGNVYWGDNVENRLFQWMDYSNLFRFMTNIVLVMNFVRAPGYLLTGMSDKIYQQESMVSYSELGLRYKMVNPHNLFFSHLRMFGLFALAEAWYIGRIMKKVVNKNNLVLFLVAVFYSVTLGAGLYSYWIVLTFIMLVSEEVLNAGGKR